MKIIEVNGRKTPSNFYGSALLVFAILSSFLWTQKSLAIEVILQAAPLYSVLQVANASNSSDSIFSGYGYHAGVRLRVPFIGVSDPQLVRVSLYGGISSVAGKNTAETTETGSLTRMAFGTDLEIWRCLIGLTYGQNTLAINYAGTSTSIPYSNLGVRAGFSLPLSHVLSIYAGGQYSMGLASSTTGAASKAITESMGFLELQYSLFDFSGGGNGQRALTAPRI